MVTWWPYQAYCAGLAEQLDLPVRWVHYLGFQRPAVAPFKLPLQLARTAWVLWHERPAVVVVQVPPAYAPVVPTLYAAWRGAGVIIDAHSQTFLSRRWRWALPLVRWLARRALAVLVTNEELAATVRAWGARALVAVSPPPAPPPLAPRAPGEAFTVVFPCAFEPDEPVEAVLAAARALPAVRFVLTGNHRKRPALAAGAPPNVELTGYLPREAFYRRLHDANALLVLTTLEHTILQGALEGMDLGQPLILSDTALLRAYFPRGAVHVPNTADGIVAGVRAVQAREAALRAEIEALRAPRRAEWETTRATIRSLIDAHWAALRARECAPGRVTA
jgi:glycosyltransferase involved in cell wall biosynthesis